MCPTYSQASIWGPHIFTGLEYWGASGVSHTSFRVVQFIGLQYSVLIQTASYHCDTITIFKPIYLSESPSSWPVITILGLLILIIIPGPGYLLQPLLPDKHSKRQKSQSMGLGCLSCSRLPMSVSYHLTSKVSQKTPNSMRLWQSIYSFHVSIDFNSL